MDSLFQQMPDDIAFCAKANSIWPGRCRSIDLWKLLMGAHPHRYGPGYLGPEGTPPEGWTDSKLRPTGFFTDWIQSTRSDFKISPAGKAFAMSKLEKLVLSSPHMRGEYHVNSSGKQLSLSLPPEHQQIKPSYFGRVRISRKWQAERLIDMCRIGQFSGKQARLDVGKPQDYQDLLNFKEAPVWGPHDTEEWPLGVPMPCFTVRHALSDTDRRVRDRDGKGAYEWRHYAVMFSELRPQVPKPPPRGP